MESKEEEMKRSDHSDVEKSPKRQKTRSRTASKESISDSDGTDREDRDHTPDTQNHTDTDDEHENTSVKSGSLKKIEIRTRSGNRLF